MAKLEQYPNLTEKEFKEYVDKFTEMAGSTDNSIALPRCVTIFYTMGWDKRKYDKDTLRTWLSSGDDNDDFQISLTELMTVINDRSKEDRLEARIRRNFKKLDDDGDGEVTKKEAEEFFEREKITDSKNIIERLFASVDADNNQTLSLDEFLKKYLAK